MSRSRQEHALTLVELIVAMGLTVLVAGSTAAILRGVAAARLRVDRQTAVQQEARAALEAIATALGNAYRSTEDDWLLEGIDRDAGDLPADRIRLFTIGRETVRRGQPASDVRECEFFLTQPERDRPPVLLRRTDPTRNEQPDGGGVLERLAGNTVGLDFAYLDGTEWRKRWPTSLRRWPAAVRLRLVVATDTQPRALFAFGRTVNFPYRPPPRRSTGE